MVMVVKKCISIGEINMYKCKVLLDKITTTPIKVRVKDKIYTMYYKQGTLTNM